MDIVGSEDGGVDSFAASLASGVQFGIPSWATSFALSRMVPSLAKHVRDIFELGSDEEVFWVNATRAVAFMQYIESIGDFDVMDDPRQTMGVYWGSSAQKKATSVVVADTMSYPLPALAKGGVGREGSVLVDLGPEAGNVTFGEIG